MIDRLDAPGSEHHVMVHAVDGQAMFHDSIDRAAYRERTRVVFARRSALCTAFDFTMDTHVHLKAIVGAVGLEDLMRPINSWYARWFNIRHDRRGHLTMDDFKSKLVGDERYSRRLTRYIVLNPIVDGVYGSLDALLDDPNSSWGELVGAREPSLLDLDAALRPFGDSQEEAVRTLRRFVADPMSEEERISCGSFPLNELDGKTVVTPLGSDAFIMQLLGDVGRRMVERRLLAAEGWTLDRLIGVAAERAKVSPETLLRDRARRVSELRSAVAHVAADRLGLRQSEIARRFGVSQGAVSLAIKRAEDSPTLSDLETLITHLRGETSAIANNSSRR